MEKKNKLFNLLRDDVKEKCAECPCLSFDYTRTEALLKKNYMGGASPAHVIQVFSPLLEYRICNYSQIRYDNDHVCILPGYPGTWSDDDDSYIIFCQNDHKRKRRR